MKKLSFLRLSFLSILLTFGLGTASIAQTMQTMYFFDHVPQSNHLNPAFRPYFGTYIGVPGISSFQLNLGWAVSISDVFVYNKQLDELIIAPLHPQGDKAKFFNAFNDRNSIYADMQWNILSFGFRVSEWFYTFDITQKAYFSFDYPGDMVRFGVELLDTTSNYDFSSLGINSSVYSEIGFGISKKIGDQWVVGGRPKILLGQANIHSESSSFRLSTHTFENKPGNYFVNEFNANSTINVYMPFADVTTSNDSLESIEMKDDIDYVKALVSPNSIGMAIDLGVTYNPIDELKLSASIIDLGFINWKKDVFNMNLKANYAFKGIENFSDTVDFAKDIMDSLTNSYGITTQKNDYRTNLAGKIFLAAEYFLHPKISLGIMSRTIILRKKLLPEFTVAGTLRPFKGLSTTLSYSLLSNNMSSMGFGISMRMGPLQSYLMTDYVPLYYSANFIPYKLSQVNFRFGSNFIFRYKDKIKKTDKPLIYL